MNRLDHLTTFLFFSCRFIAPLSYLFTSLFLDITLQSYFQIFTPLPLTLISISVTFIYISATIISISINLFSISLIFISISVSYRCVPISYNSFDVLHYQTQVPFKDYIQVHSILQVRYCTVLKYLCRNVLYCTLLNPVYYKTMILR